ncbi:sensor histidine kinase [Streptococcus loxodontisalivarius]|uniref:histidine kinase n=1 Tax=Streptococcus loxodontisalivarius TaxID=1349415 RepID=A0ABS2PS83_9STRE|nr:HAMP domain-containing sensor histidine kinase [Streptococcus loxodontisalivarius]MBM7642902.1 K+-sensing histidine kinase KdpD [Streptococcus loxodontisalivarius]
MAILPWFKSRKKIDEKVEEDIKKLTKSTSENTKLFRSLRIRFVLIAALSVFVVLGTTVGVITAVRNIQARNNIDSILTALVENGGNMLTVSEASKSISTSVTEETIYTYRYFSVTMDSDGDITSTNSQSFASLTDDEISDFAKRIYSKGQTSGTIHEDDTYYSYQVKKSKSSTLIVVFDSTTYYSDAFELTWVAIQIAVLCMIVFVLMISAMSKRVIEPFIRNYQKQRRFITNAGHELKTPLAIISANNELVELMNGESEWTKSTADQVTRLTGLINGLVALSRLEEQPDIVLTDLDFSYIAEDAAEDFKGPVIRGGKTFSMDIDPGIHVKAEEKSLFELVTLLVDNANKYCDEGGHVSVRLKSVGRTRKRARLTISNTYAEGATVDYSRFFERFYREDESHNSKRKGYGIGLSTAQSIVRIFKGRISASFKDDIFTITVII